MTDRPTWSWVQDQLARRRQVFSGMHGCMQGDEDLHYWSSGPDNWRGQVAVGLNALHGLPKGFSPSFPPLAFLGVMVGVNRITSGKAPEIDVRLSDEAPERDSKDSRRRIDLMKRWGNAWLYHVATFSTENPLRDLPTKQLKLGLGALSYSIDYERWPDHPFGWRVDERGNRQPKRGPRTRDESRRVDAWQQKRRGAFPWDVRSLSPTWVYFDDGRDPPRDYILQDEVNASEVQAAYPKLAGRFSDHTGKLKRVTYCGADWYGVWVDETPLLGAGDGADEDGIAPNAFGRPWLRMAWSGFGDSSSGNDWAMKGKGVLRDGRAIILELCQAWNELRALALVSTFPGRELIGPEDETLALESTMEVGVAAMMRHTDRVQVKVQELPKVPEIVIERYKMAREMFSEHFGEPVLRGQPQSEPATSQRARATAAGLPFAATQTAGEQLVAGMLVDVFGMVKHYLREPVTVRGVTLRPEDVIEDVIVEVNYTPMTDEDRAFKRAEAEKDLQAGAITLEEYIRIVRGVEDGAKVLADVRKEKLTDAILGDPQVLALGVQKLLGQLGASSPAPGAGGETAPEAPGQGPSPEPQPGQVPMRPSEPFGETPPGAMGGPFEAQDRVNGIYGAPLLPVVPGR